jgi:hypothetical protein
MMDADIRCRIGGPPRISANAECYLGEDAPGSVVDRLEKTAELHHAVYLAETDCVAGVVGLELRNPFAS